jgi:uncharacterized protein
MEAGALSALVATALGRAWRAESTLHGDEHWRCVGATGLALVAWVADADRILVFCFGLLHDTRRLTDGADPEHGARAAAFAEELKPEGLLTLDDLRFAALTEALVDHSGGLVSDDPTTGVCWDADRLHLPRVSIALRGELLSTRAARGEAPVAAAALLRSNGPPSWDVLVDAAVRR